MPSSKVNFEHILLQDSQRIKLFGQVSFHKGSSSFDKLVIEDQVFMLSYFPQRIKLLVFLKNQVVWLSNIVANVKLHFKLKEYIVPHVETEKSSIQEKCTSILLLADRSIPIDYFIYQRQELLYFAFKIKCWPFILWCWIIDIILTHSLAMV